MKDVLRAAIASPALKIADVTFNKNEILKQAHAARAAGATLLLLPELSLTGYTCGDLFAAGLLLDRAKAALTELAAELPDGLLTVVGAPLSVGSVLYNCAVFLADKKILGAVPKTHLSSNGNAPESRWFSPGAELACTDITLGDHIFPIGTDLIFAAPDGTTLAAELCEDLFVPVPPSSYLAQEGAEVILNLAATLELVGKRAYRRELVLSQSARTHSAYLLAGAGMDESTADFIYPGHSLAALGGELVAENEHLIDGNYLLTLDLDLGKIRYDRRRKQSFSAMTPLSPCTRVALPFALCCSDGAMLAPSRLPFIPSSKQERTERCMQIYEMQAAALARRLSITGGKLTLGISGGLDSTLALLVAVRAMERLSLPASNIIAVTMPCFGTSDATLSNALKLMEALGVTSKTVSIKEAVLTHFADIGHDPADYSTTYENAQARERTQVLMDIANKEGGIVLGTGDLSEMALGWCTYNGDHMSMYAVNAGVPKTLVRWIIECIADASLVPKANDVLRRILDTPISPELLPPDATGKISQKTEDIVGPYALHDFFLYWAVRYQYTPAKILELASLAFDGVFDTATIKKWLTVFVKRFFTQQFKRNCVPDGVKIGTVGLSPRGDWVMPSDATAAEWLRELDQL